MWLPPIKCSNVFTSTGEQVAIQQPLVALAKPHSYFSRMLPFKFRRMLVKRVATILSWEAKTSMTKFHSTGCLIKWTLFSAENTLGEDAKKCRLLFWAQQWLFKITFRKKTLWLERVTRLKFSNAWWRKRSEAPLVNRKLQFGVYERED